MTYDLSEIISDGGIDGEDRLDQLLHWFTSTYPDKPLSDVLHVVRDLALTQNMSVTDQLNTGLRFLDFRIMYESTGKRWRCLHMLETNGFALDYLEEIRQWMDAHPTEIVVLWLSKHGNEHAVGNRQYPDVSVETKRAFWTHFVETFSSLLMNHTESSMNVTTIQTLVERKHRLIALVSDYEEMTANSTLALDARNMLDNNLPGSMWGPSAAVPLRIEQFRDGQALRDADFASGKLWLESFSGEGPDSTDKQIAELTILGEGSTEITKTCARAYNVTPAMDSWCPPTLLQQSQLFNYYMQQVFEVTHANILADEDGWNFPAAFYLNAVDFNGTFRVGTAGSGRGPTEIACAHETWTSCSSKPPTCPAGFVGTGETEHFTCYDADDGKKHSFCFFPWENHYRCCKKPVDGHGTARYGFVDTLISANVHIACRNVEATKGVTEEASEAGGERGRTKTIVEMLASIVRGWFATTAKFSIGDFYDEDCDSIKAVVAERRKLFPMATWNDPVAGRLPVGDTAEGLEYGG
eukprot:g4266.t1